MKVLLCADQEVTGTVVLRDRRGASRYLAGVFASGQPRFFVPWNEQTVLWVNCCVERTMPLGRRSESDWLRITHCQLDGATVVGSTAVATCDQTAGRLTRCCETAAGAGLLILEKSSGHGFQERVCFVASSK